MNCNRAIWQSAWPGNSQLRTNSGGHRGCYFATCLHFYTHNPPPQHNLTFQDTTHCSYHQPKIHSSITSATTMENSHTSTLVSPDINTPPAATKRNPTNGHITNGAERAGSEPVDAIALGKALKDMEDAGRVRERTPGASPSRKRQRVYGDRSVKYQQLKFSSVLGVLKRIILASLVISMIRRISQADCATARIGMEVDASLHLDLFPTEKVKTSRLASAYYMTMHRLQHHREQRKGLLMESSISRKVSKFLQHLARHGE